MTNPGTAYLQEGTDYSVIQKIFRRNKRKGLRESVSYKVDCIEVRLTPEQRILFEFNADGSLFGFTYDEVDEAGRCMRCNKVIDWDAYYSAAPDDEDDDENEGEEWKK